jgi:antitoxin component YwqK of YwqJK toxin-antitoxin module
MQNINNSKQLTDGLIIFSALVSDYEKLDFKNDALAGVRANYFNSNCMPQDDKTEVYLNSDLYNLSYHMSSNSPLSWKVTRNNRPYQSVKKETGGIYCVIFYEENGIVFKRQYFDEKHNWLRTEYFDRSFEGILHCRIYPKTICGIVALQIERIKQNGDKEVEQLFPSLRPNNLYCTALLYTNTGMLWYDKSFRPTDLAQETSETDKPAKGFEFKEEYFIPDDTDEVYDITDSDYLLAENIQAVEPEPETAPSSEEEKPYSAYDTIEQILKEAHKSNKDLFGEIINHPYDDNSEILPEEISDQPQLEPEQPISEELPEAEEVAEEKIEEEPKIEPKEELGKDVEQKLNSEIQDLPDLEPEQAYNVATQEPDGDILIRTTSGSYTYYGKLDSEKNRTGRGRTTTPDGLTSYDGDYLNDLRHGFGVCYYKSGSINYVGNWDNNNRNGCGVGYRLSDGTMHAGKWLENSPNGYGARFDKDGNFLDICKYDCGVRNGKSVSFDENGDVVITKWINGEKVTEQIIKTED